MSYENLYSDLIDNYAEQLKFAPNDYAKMYLKIRIFIMIVGWKG